MPNWCKNDILLLGQKEDIDKIVIIDFDFQKIRPVPKKLLENDDDGGWYHWCNEFWGTKWTARNVVMTRRDTCALQITFVTAWNRQKNC